MAHVDAGIALSYMQLISQSLDLSSCIVVGFLEHLIDSALNLSQDDYPISAICFGHKSSLNKNLW